MYLLKKNISNIVSGLLSGQPSLGGSMMTAQLKNTVNKGAAAAGHVAAARDEAGGVLKPGFLANIAKEAAINGTPIGTAVNARKLSSEFFKTSSKPEVTLFKAKKDDK